MRHLPCRVVFGLRPKVSLEQGIQEYMQWAQKQRWRSTLVEIMKVALMADIHANLPALKAVMDDLPEVDSIVCLGDVVGYYADPNEVCDLLQKYKIPTVRGNHDAYVVGHADSESRPALAHTAPHGLEKHLHLIICSGFSLCQSAWSSIGANCRLNSVTRLHGMKKDTYIPTLND